MWTRLDAKRKGYLVLSRNHTLSSRIRHVYSRLVNSPHLWSALIDHNYLCIDARSPPWSDPGVAALHCDVSTGTTPAGKHPSPLQASNSGSGGYQQIRRTTQRSPQLPPSCPPSGPASTNEQPSRIEQPPPRHPIVTRRAEGTTIHQFGSQDIRRRGDQKH